MMISESEIIPYYATSPPGNRVLVLAPHPDDETLGCGGAISLLAEARKDIKVIFLTSGDKADPSHPLSNRAHQKTHITDYSALREKEADKALLALGVPDYEFLRFPDRGLAENFEDVFIRLLNIFKNYRPDAVYCPSMIELNPDHRTASGLAIELQKAMASPDDKDMIPFSLIFYEVTTPMRPNLLVDVTAVYEKKKKALKKYKSQLKLVDYFRHIKALNEVRTLTVSPVRKRAWGFEKSCKYAEAFWLADSLLTDEDIIKWLSYREDINTK